MRTNSEKTRQLLRIVSDLLGDASQKNDKTKNNDENDSGLAPGVESRIAAILKDESRVQAGHIQVIGLGALKEHLGDKWPEKRSVIYEVLQSIISRRLTQHDVFFQKSEDEFLVVFARLNADAARFVCARILQELNLHFLGNASLTGIVVRTAVGVLNGELVYEKTNMQQLLSNFSEVDAEMADTAYFKGSTTSEAQLERTWAARSYRGQALAGQLPRGLKLTYRLMWDVKNEVLSGCTIDYQQQRGNALVPAYQAIRDEHSIRAMDVSLLRHAIEELTRMVDGGSQLLVCVPIHYETVLTPALLHDYVKECEAIPEELRPYLLFACDQFPAGVPQSKMSLIAQAVRPYCRFVAANVEMAFRDFASFSNTGVTVTGCYLSGHTMSTEQLETRIRKFVASAHEFGMPAVFLGVHDVATARVARAAGAHLLEGEVIGRRHTMPERMIRKSWSEISGEAA